MRDRYIRGAFVALIFTFPALIVFATSVTRRSVLEMLAVEVVVAAGLIFAAWVKAHAQRPKAVVALRFPMAKQRAKRSVRSVA